MRRIQVSLFSLFFTLLFSTSISEGQTAWSGIIAPTRAVNWNQAGAGTIPTRNTICATESAGVSLSQLNTDIANCPANQVVFLNAGTYSFSGQIFFNHKSNVTLRGAGPNSTIVNFTAHGGCTGLMADVCIVSGDTGDFAGSPSNIATWTGGYAQGATSITIGSLTKGSISNMVVGSLLVLDQADPATDNGNLWIAANSGYNGAASQQGAVAGRAGRAQFQTVTVTSISGTGPWTIGITPGLYAPNWNSSQSPGVWWANGAPVTGVGIENITLNHSGSNGSGVYGMGIQWVNATNSWMLNVRSLNDQNGVSQHTEFFQSVHNTVQNSYFYGSNNASEGYGATCDFSSADNLVVNNIMHHVAAPYLTQGCIGTVFAYNFSLDDYFGSGAWQGGSGHHSGGDMYNLYESNQGLNMGGDDIHGNSGMLTFFRENNSGLEPITSDGVKSESTIPYSMLAGARYNNYLGNVLGTAGYHNTYQIIPSSTTDCTHNPWTTIYAMGYSNQNQIAFTPGCIDSSFTVYNDLLVHSTAMRWGNWDVVTNATRFCTASATPSTACTEDERGDSATTYPALSSPKTSFPSSFFLNGTPPWWSFPSGTTAPFPAIGPDVSGGNVANFAGHAFLIPSANCYKNVLGGSMSGTASGQLPFDANNCYPNSAALTPSAPTNLTGTVVQ